MESNQYFQMIIVIALIAYGIYTLAKVIKVYMEHVKLRKAYQEANKGKYEFQQDYYVWGVTYCLVTLFAFAGTIVNIMNKDYVMASAFFFMGTFCASFVLDVLMKRQAFFGKEGFFFETKTYNYRSVIRMEPRKSFIQSYDLFLTNQNSIRITRKMGDKLAIKLKEYKRHKK
ncbi:MAG: hypothetical protein RR537_06140 [Longicatena sp.]